MPHQPQRAEIAKFNMVSQNFTQCHISSSSGIEKLKLSVANTFVLSRDIKAVLCTLAIGPASSGLLTGCMQCHLEREVLLTAVNVARHAFQHEPHMRGHDGRNSTGALIEAVFIKPAIRSH